MINYKCETCEGKQMGKQNTLVDKFYKCRFIIINNKQLKLKKCIPLTRLRPLWHKGNKLSTKTVIKS